MYVIVRCMYVTVRCRGGRGEVNIVGVAWGEHLDSSE